MAGAHAASRDGFTAVRQGAISHARAGRRCPTLGPIARLLVLPERRHQVRLKDREALDALDGAVADLEQIDDAVRVRVLDRDRMLAAVARLVLDEARGVVEEGERNDDAALLVDDRITPRTHAVDGLVVADLELRAAAARGRALAVREIDAVRDAPAIRRELAEQLAVVELHRVVVAFGERDQPLARTALVGG